MQLHCAKYMLLLLFESCASEFGFTGCGGCGDWRGGVVRSGVWGDGGISRDVGVVWVGGVGL